MEMADLVNLQKQFDKRHGWDASDADETTTIDFIARDIVGLVGEIGEFANLIKKLQLLERYPQQMSDEFRQCRKDLSMELVDSFIYVLRLAELLDIDLEETYLEKLSMNTEQFKQFETRE